MSNQATMSTDKAKTQASESAPGKTLAKLSVNEYAARIRTWFFSPAPSAAFVWLLLIVVLVGVLAGFFLFSPYLSPAAPVYAEF